MKATTKIHYPFSLTERGVCITESVPFTSSCHGFPMKTHIILFFFFSKLNTQCYESLPDWSSEHSKVEHHSSSENLPIVLKTSMVLVASFRVITLILFSTLKKSFPCLEEVVPTDHSYSAIPTQIGIQIHCLFKEERSVANIRIQSILKLCLQCSNARKNSVGLGMLCSNVPNACGYS